MKEAEKKLPLDEKLRLIDREIRILHEFCVTKGYDPMLIEKHAEPILDAVWEARKQKYKSYLCKILTVMLIFSAVIYCEPVYKLVCVYSRLGAIGVLPYWDWTKLHRTDCLVQNPYFEANKLREEDCELCEHLESIKRIENVSHNVMAEDYLKRDIPVIVTDATHDWPARNMFNINFLNTLYSNEETLLLPEPCMFLSNVRSKRGLARAVLDKGAKGDISNWYAHWENCDRAAAKTMRQFYRRPYFLPPMVESGEFNWIFVASHYSGKKNKPTDIALPMMWVAQIKGSMKVTLIPRDPCKQRCPTLYATLHEGDTLVFTDLMWVLDYMPIDSGEMIAIGSGGYFD